MKRIISPLIILSLLVVKIDVTYSSVSIDSLIITSRDQLNQSINNFNEDLIKESIEKFEQLLIYNQKVWLINYYIAFGYYKSGLYYFNEQNVKNANESFGEAFLHINNCISVNDSFAEGYIMKANIIKIKSAIEQFNSAELDSEVHQCFEHAKKLDPGNPRIYYSLGILNYFQPKIYGGDIEVAKENFAKAIELYSIYKPKYKVYPDWGFDETYAWLGKIASDQGNIKLAKKYYKKALDVNPDFDWVKKDLLPNLISNNKFPILFISVGILIIIIAIFIFYYLNKRINRQ